MAWRSRTGWSRDWRMRGLPAPWAMRYSITLVRRGHRHLAAQQTGHPRQRCAAGAAIPAAASARTVWSGKICGRGVNQRADAAAAFRENSGDVAAAIAAPVARGARVSPARSQHAEPDGDCRAVRLSGHVCLSAIDPAAHGAAARRTSARAFGARRAAELSCFFLLADAAFLAGEQLGDIGAVARDEQHRHQRNRPGNPVEAVHQHVEERREHRRHQRRQR